MRQLLSLMLAVLVLASSCARRPLPPASWDGPETEDLLPLPAPPPPPPPPPWRAGPLPSAPAEPPTLTEHLAARPKSWSQPKLVSPATRAFPLEPAVKVADGPTAGIACVVDLPQRPRRKGVWTLTIVEGDQQMSAMGGATTRWVLPFVDTQKPGPRKVALSFSPSLDLLVLADASLRPMGAATLDLTGAPPWRAQGKAFSATCEPLFRAELEAVAQRYLADAQAWLDQQPPPTLDLDELNPRPFQRIPFDHAMEASSALLGWADPRVLELVRRFAALEAAAQEAARDAVAQRREASPSVPSVSRSGEVELLSAALDCDPKAVRRLKPAREHADCLLRMRLRHVGPGVLQLDDLGMKNQSALFDAQGRMFRIGNFYGLGRRSSLIQPGEEVEVVSLLYRSEGEGVPEAPLLLRLASVGPLVLPNAPEPTPIPGREASVAVGAFACPQRPAKDFECQVPVTFHWTGELNARSGRSPPAVLAVESLCTGRRAGSISAFNAFYADPPYTLNAKATLYRGFASCGKAPMSFGVRLDGKRWDYLHVPVAP